MGAARCAGEIPLLLSFFYLLATISLSRIAFGQLFPIRIEISASGGMVSTYQQWASDVAIL